MKTNKRKLFTVLLVIACLVLITAVFVACNGDLADALKLGTPQNVTINEADFTLKWDAVSGAKSYEVQIDGEVKATAETSYSLKALATEHKVYKIRVKAIAPEDNFLLVDSDFSQEITCEPATYIFNYEANSPLKITGLTAFGLTLETVVIPSKIEGATVTAIGSGAFENNAVMVSVVIPATVATVGDNAFKGATALFSVVFFRDSEEGPTELGEGVFDGATGLTNIIVPEGSSDSYREEIIKTAPELAEVVREKAFESIEITTLPKVAYNAGETLDLSGMAGVLKFSDGSQIPLGNNYSVLLPSGTGGAGSGNRELSVSDTKFTLSVTYGSVTILKEILITVTAPNSNDNQGQAQIGLYNLLTNDLYMGYKFTIPNNNISWGALISGTYLNGNFASLNALIATITTEMLKLTIPKNGTNNPKLVQIGVNGEIIEITAGTVILRDTNVRLYFHGSDVPTAGLQKLASPNNVRLSPVASAPLLIWDNVPNASGYLVSVAGGTAQTVNSNQFNLSAVTAEGEHLILVTAKGDGVTYADSNATAYMYLIVKSGGGGETEIISVNFTAGELQVALNAMSSNPMPPTGFPNWGVLLSFFGKSDLEAFKKEVMAQISLDKGFKVVDIYLLGGAPITVNTQLNPNYMISYEAPKSQPTLNTIAFNAGLGKFLDGTSAKTVEVPNGTAVGTMETPTRAGFTFMGWYENQFAYDLNEPTTRSWNLQAMWNDNGGNQGENPSQAVQADLMNTFRGINQSIVTPNPPQTWGMAMSQGGYSSLNALIEAVKLRISATNGGKAVTNIVQVGLYGASVEITMTTQINSNTMIIAYFA